MNLYSISITYSVLVPNTEFFLEKRYSLDFKTGTSTHLGLTEIWSSSLLETPVEVPCLKKLRLHGHKYVFWSQI